MAATPRSGFSTVEAMVALVVFAVGVLGAAGTMAVAWRAEMAGERASAASRMAGSVLDSVRTEVINGGGRCTGVSSGAEAGAHGTTASWSTAPSVGGREVWLTVAFASIAALATDTVWTFVPCR